jgi:6-phosphofructokinase 1
MDAFEGILSDPFKLIQCSLEKVAGIHVKGGAILHTSSMKKPLNYPVRQVNRVWEYEDITDKLLQSLIAQGIDAVINIRVDGSQLGKMISTILNCQG